MGIFDALNPYSSSGFLANLNGTFPERLIPDGLIPSIADRKPATRGVMFGEFVPVLALFYILAVLVQLPNTRVLRLSVLVAMGMLAWRVSTRYDYDGSDEPGHNLSSMTVCWFMSFLMLRATDLANEAKPFVRERFSWLPPNAPKDFSTQLKGALLNAFDLTFNARGIGWNWGKSIYIPPSTPSSRKGPLDFLIGHVITQTFFDFVLFAQQSWDLSPSKYPTHRYGGTIFNPDLPPLRRYGKVMAMTFICPLGLCTSFQATYYLIGFLGMTVFGQVAEQWPPIFQAPWMATSLADFWGLRWHQVFKRSFVVCGAKPAAQFFGRAGGVIGAFFVSGIMHDFGVWGSGLGTELSSVTLFFVMMGVGCVLEGIWKEKTGSKVRGPLGWFWAMAWMFFWGSWIVDAWARRGLIISKMSADAARPSLYWVYVAERWVKLHGKPLQ
ncbi:membrane bound O-acyl transferase family-domain-containing protein [Russula ochroleuca]|uniref:Membrane bound O-acyl transferase family-domain-containing protein n=1 Tax=Russula ochroleuca TaxID=152965 RepID=A0A9P5N4R9_9AGAM|nr:membrane bound O-acyl transferase family-domain-containing protein [Russula ochroleuca]